MLTEARPALAVEEITTTEGLERLRPEWASLWERCVGATPFQSPEWLIPWWRHIGEGSLWTLALRERGRLVGLAPLYIYTRPGSSVRELFLLGIGTSDHLDALFESGYEQRGAAAVLAHLDAACYRWDVCDLQDLRPESPLMQAAPPEHWTEQTMVQESCPVLRLPHREEDIGRSVPARMLHNLRYYTRRAEKQGEVRIEGANRENLMELFDGLLRLHRARWSSLGEAGVLADPAIQQQHREALPELLERGLLRLYALRLDGRIVASFYGFADSGPRGGRVYYYLGGFDPAVEALSPGTLLIGHAVREAVRAGAEAFDFLRGREEYKYLWGAQDQWSYRRLLWHAGEPAENASSG